MKKKTLKEIMTTQLITVNEFDTMEGVLEGMEHFGIRHLPVVDGKKVIGLLSPRDVLNIAITELEITRPALQRGERISRHSFIAEVMDKKIFKAKSDMLISEAAEMLIKEKSGSIIVVNNDDELEGIVTEYDLLKLVVEENLLK